MEDGLGPVQRGLKSPSAGDRFQALYRVGNSRIKGCAEDVLLLMWQDRNPSIKERCAWVLGRLHYQVAYPYLVANLKHPSPKVRTWSAWALGELGLDRARIPLRSAIKREPEDDVRSAIGGALKKLAFEPTRIHRNEVIRALRPPWIDDEQIISIVERLEKLTFPQDKDEIIALRSRMKDENISYFAEYMNWVRRKPGLMAMADDERKVFR